MSFNSEVKQNLKAFLRGEKTWAEVEGITAEDAHRIADIGCDLAATGNLQQARILFEGLVAVNPYDAAARAALGTVLQKLDRVPEAVEQYTASIEVDPSNVVALANRGELLIKRGDENGYGDLARAVTSDPTGETSAGRRAGAIIKAFTLKAIEAGRAV